MGSEFEQQVRERAYAIWKREGQPDGRAEEHWFRAVAEIETGDRRLASRELALDKAIDDSFPASDPPSMTQPAPSAIDKDRL